MKSSVIVQQSVLLCCAYSATLTWTGQSASGHFNDAGNWNTNTLPTRLDHVNILSGANVKITQDTVVMSMRVAGNAVLEISGNFEYQSGIVVDETATVRVKSGSKISTPSSPVMTVASNANPTPSVSYPTITVGGILELEDAGISGSAPGSGTQNVEFPSVIMVNGKGQLKTSGRSSISNARVLISSSMSTSGDSLLLNFASLETSGKAVFTVASNIQNVNAEPLRASSITISGESTLDTHGQISIHVPITVGSTAVMQVQGDTLLQSPSTLHGSVVISPNGHLSVSASSTFSGSSSIQNHGQMSILSGTTKLRGNINGAGAPAGVLVVRSALNMYSLAFLDTLSMEGGTLQLLQEGDLQGSVRAKTSVLLSAGQILGTTDSTVSIDRTGQFLVSNGKTQKVLSNVNIIASGSTNTVEAGASLTLQDNAQVIIDSDASIAFLTGSSLLGTTGVLTLVGTGSALVDTGASIGCHIKGNGHLILTKTSTLNAVEISAPTISLGRLSTLPQDAEIDAKFVCPLTMTSSNPTYMFPASVQAPKTHLTFSNVITTAGSGNTKALWNLHKLTLIGAELRVEGNVNVADVITLGMDKNAGAITNGIYSARILNHQTGSFIPLNAVIGNQECPLERIVEVIVPSTAPSTAPSTDATTAVPADPIIAPEVAHEAAGTCTTTQQSVITPPKDTFVGLDAKKAAEIFFYLFIALSIIMALAVSYLGYKRLKQPEKPSKTYENPGRATSINMSGMSGGLGIVGGNDA